MTDKEEQAAEFGIERVDPGSVEVKPVTDLPPQEAYPYDYEREKELKEEEIKRQHTDYAAQHPEIKQIVSDFLTALLLEKPRDVYLFATQYFECIGTEEDM